MHPKAERALARRSPVFRKLVRDIGPCTLVPDPDSFKVLTRMIVSQLISTAAARSIFGKVETLLGTVTPAAFLARPEAELRACGLSPAKLAAIRAFADRATAEPEFLPSLATCDDVEVAARLLPFKGVGVWTVEMFLMFGLGRPDVWPVGDLGVRLAVRDLFAMAEVPKPKDLRPFADEWKPYRTVATWYLWKSRGFVPQSGA